MASARATLSPTIAGSPAVATTAAMIRAHTATLLRFLQLHLRLLQLLDHRSKVARLRTTPSATTGNRLISAVVCAAQAGALSSATGSSAIASQNATSAVLTS